MSDFTAFASNAVDLDQGVFHDWLAGRSVSESVALRLHKLRVLEAQHRQARAAAVAAAAIAPTGSAAGPQHGESAPASLAASVADLATATAAPDASANNTGARPPSSSDPCLDSSSSQPNTAAASGPLGSFGRRSGRRIAGGGNNAGGGGPIGSLGRASLTPSISRASLQLANILGRSAIGTPRAPSSTSSLGSSGDLGGPPGTAGANGGGAWTGGRRGYAASASGSAILSRRGSILGDIRRAVGSMVDSLGGRDGGNGNGGGSTLRHAAGDPAHGGGGSGSRPGWPASAAGAASSSACPDPNDDPAAAMAYAQAQSRMLSVHLHVVAQYRTFATVEPYLHRPRHFLTQTVVPLPGAVRRALVRQYYSFDERVMRELLGKKLNSRTRRELDELVGARAGATSVLAARRMFDNLKRIMKRTEDAADVVATIMDEFVLPLDLASRYGAIIFIATHRLETSKRKLALYTFADFEYCAAVFQTHWTRSASSDDLITMTQDVREVKAIFLASKELMEEYRTAIEEEAQQRQQQQQLAAAVAAAEAAAAAAGIPENPAVPAFVTTGPLAPLSTQVSEAGLLPATPAATLAVATSATPTVGAGGAVAESPSAVTTTTQAQFRMLVRNVLAIGAGLSQSKELRDIFVDLVDKVVEPCAGLGWTLGDVEAFFDALERQFATLPGINSRQRRRFHPSFARLLMGVKLATLRMFRRRIAADEEAAAMAMAGAATGTLAEVAAGAGMAADGVGGRAGVL
ncbi:hypothetical protein H9P43_001591 [Blastocladiella emersonii ATCC 22665]|nr:hypothetical protein H9P43_001591 [Blastocladiella emersonii ATCC 22665]